MSSGHLPEGTRIHHLGTGDDTTESSSSSFLFFSHLLDRVPLMVLAGLANSAGQTVGHPFDLLKLRMQIQGRSREDTLSPSSSSRSTSPSSSHLTTTRKEKYGGPISGLRTIVHEEGAIGLFSAWRVSIARELWCGGLRVGLYEPAKELLGASDPEKTPLHLKIGAGLLSGTISSCLCNPLDLLKVRYMAVSGEDYKKLPTATRAFVNLTLEGPRAMWRGFVPNTFRSAGITATQLSAYDHIKHSLLNRGLFEEGKPLHVVTSIGSSVISIAVTNPVDVIKTRMMNFPQEGSMKNVALGIYKKEGTLAFYAGAQLSWFRLGPHTVVTFTTFEYLRSLAGIKPM